MSTYLNQYLDQFDKKKSSSLPKLDFNLSELPHVNTKINKYYAPKVEKLNLKLACDNISSDEWMAETHKILQMSERAFLNTQNPTKCKAKIFKKVQSDLEQIDQNNQQEYQKSLLKLQPTESVNKALIQQSLKSIKRRSTQSYTDFTKKVNLLTQHFSSRSHEQLSPIGNYLTNLNTRQVTINAFNTVRKKIAPAKFSKLFQGQEDLDQKFYSEYQTQALGKLKDNKIAKLKNEMREFDERLHKITNRKPLQNIKIKTFTPRSPVQKQNENQKEWQQIKSFGSRKFKADINRQMMEQYQRKKLLFMQKRKFYLKKYRDERLLEAYSIFRKKMYCKTYFALFTIAQIIEKFKDIIYTRNLKRAELWAKIVRSIQIQNFFRKKFYKWPKYTILQRHRNYVASSIDFLTVPMQITCYDQAAQILKLVLKKTSLCCVVLEGKFNSYMKKIIRLQWAFKLNKIRSAVEILKVRRQFDFRCSDLNIEFNQINRIFSLDITRLKFAQIMDTIKQFVFWRKMDFKKKVLQWETAVDSLKFKYLTIETNDQQIQQLQKLYYQRQDKAKELLKKLQARNEKEFSNFFSLPIDTLGYAVYILNEGVLGYQEILQNKKKFDSDKNNKQDYQKIKKFRISTAQGIVKQFKEHYYVKEQNWNRSLYYFNPDKLQRPVREVNVSPEYLAFLILKVLPESLK